MAVAFFGATRGLNEQAMGGRQASITAASRWPARNAPA